MSDDDQVNFEETDEENEKSFSVVNGDIALIADKDDVEDMPEEEKQNLGFDEDDSEDLDKEETDDEDDTSTKENVVEENSTEEDAENNDQDAENKSNEVELSDVPTVSKLPIEPIIDQTAELEKKIFGDADEYLKQSSEQFSDKKSSIKMDELNVLLTFEVGKQSITIKELETLRPGYIFQGSNPVDVPVDIKANGRAIGKGQLIDVGGRIGVQIMELF